MRGAVTSCSLGKELNNLPKADTNTSVRGQTHSMEGKAARRSYPKPKELLMFDRTKLPRLGKGQPIIACIQLMYECLTIWLTTSDAPDQGKQLLPTEVCEKHELGWTGDEQMRKWAKRAFKITQPNTRGHQYLSLVCTYHKIINQQRINLSQQQKNAWPQRSHKWN